MSDLIERMAAAMYVPYASGFEMAKTWDSADPRDKKEFCNIARTASAALFNDPDIQAFLKWIDFKQSGKPDQEWDGARKLLVAAGFKP